MTAIAYLGARLFDGDTLQTGRALLIGDGQVQAIADPAALPVDAGRVDLNGGILAPGFVDLQVNGGGGVMFNDAPTVRTLATIAAAHARLGATAILPTLITDTPGVTAAAIGAAAQAIHDRVPGIIGLHLEGPHLSLAKKGAHDGDLIRPMEETDLALYCAAAQKLPVLKLTVAPETVTPGQIATLTRAGAIVSLGHSDCSVATARQAVQAGATCVTHLFNAMSPLASREPGLVGAALVLGDLSAGVIGDGIHVHPDTLWTALAAKQGPGRVFLVSDAMAVAGTDATEFTLNGRPVTRSDGRLTLADGTLAGADLDLARAVRMIAGLGEPQERALDRAQERAQERALAMATSIPAEVVGQGDRLGRLGPGRAADFIWLTDALDLAGVWRDGHRQVP